MNDWTTFTKRITVNASQEDIYKAWTTQHGIESWFLRSSEFTKNKILRGRNEFTQTGDETVQIGEILETNGVDVFSFTFHEPMVVSVRIFEEHSFNICELIQTSIPLNEDSRKNYFVGCGEGWTFYLTNLKSVLEGGLDLRNKDENIKSVLNS